MKNINKILIIASIILYCGNNVYAQIQTTQQSSYDSDVEIPYTKSTIMIFPFIEVTVFNGTIGGLAGSKDGNRESQNANPQILQTTNTIPVETTTTVITTTHSSDNFFDVVWSIITFPVRAIGSLLGITNDVPAAQSESSLSHTVVVPSVQPVYDVRSSGPIQDRAGTH